MAGKKKTRTAGTSAAPDFKGFTDKQKREAAVALEITTGIGKKYGIKVEPAGLGKPVLIAVHL